LNAGLRFDQMVQYVNANQLSPRLSLTYTPFDGTVFHAGYARYFTPPQQVLAAPTNLALVQNTSQQPEVNRADPVLPERSHYSMRRDPRLLPASMSVSTPTTRSRATCSTTASSARPMC